MRPKPNYKRDAVRRIRKPARQYIPDAVALTSGIHCIDALELARRMPSESVQCIVTSPPYFGLRDYQTARWEGGSADCDHSVKLGGHGQKSSKQVSSNGTQFYQYRDTCPKCGAVRIDRQIGLEGTPQAYIQRLVDLFRELRRVLRKDGVLWLNLGDSYAGSGRGPVGKNGIGQHEKRQGFHSPVKNDYGLGGKQLLGIPHRVAFALQTDGWILRSDIIWAKPNPMPESVKDRPTKAHEYIFLLTKSPRYFYDADAVREPHKEISLQRVEYGLKHTHPDNVGVAIPPVDVARMGERFCNPLGRNMRSVWEITTKSYPGAHFATFPPEIPELCIKAGSRKGDIVYDPFMGAGTTALVARNLGRRYIGSELNPQYIKLALDRLNDEFGVSHVPQESKPLDELPLFVGMTA